MSLRVKWGQSLQAPCMKALEKYVIRAGYTMFLLFHRVVKFPSDGQPQRPLLIAFSHQPVTSGALELSCGRCCRLVTSHMGT